MPTVTLNDADIKKALNFLTKNKYYIYTIVKKRITKDNELEIVWSYNVR